MRILAIGDPHGVKRWTTEDLFQADRIVFMGDYWDSFDVSFEKQKEVFLEIVALKQQRPDIVTLLLGNHDIHYMLDYSKYVESGIIVGSGTSGFQDSKKFEINALMEEHKNLFQHVYQFKNYVFSHAGISSLLLNHYKESIFLTDVEKKHLENNLFEMVFNKVKLPALLWVGNENLGYDEFSGLFWVRPKQLLFNIPVGIKQVVGHTYNRLPIVSEHVTFVDCETPVMIQAW
jgi:hypothetical protein